MLQPFSPSAGLNSDDTTFSSEGRWADGSNVRFWNGQPQTVGGTTSGFTLPAAPICYDLFAFTRSGSATIVYGQSAALYIATGFVSPSVRTPASIGTNADSGWTFATWGDTLLAAGRGTAGADGGRLYEQSGSGVATHVTQAPARNKCILVTNERQVLSFGCNEEISGTYNGLCIRGSDIEDYTDWTTSATNNAFEHILDGPGVIVTAKQVGPYIAVWTTSALYLGQFIGDPLQTYRFDKVADECAPASIRAVAVFGGAAYWVGADKQLRTWAPGGQVQVIPCPISYDFTANSGTLDDLHTFIVANHRFQEIWFFYYDTRDTPPPEVASRYIAYSIAESIREQRPIWFRGILERTAMLATTALGTAEGIIGVDQNEAVVRHEGGGFLSAGAYIQSADWYLDNSQRRVMIRGCRPDFEDINNGTEATMTLTLYMKNYPQGTATTKGPHTITTATTKKDFRATGKIAAMKFTAGTGAMRLGKPIFDIVPMGER